MSAGALAAKYISSAEKVFNQMDRAKAPITADEKCINNIIKYAADYLEDAKYYKAQKKFETSLTSIAYCEGLLDALKLLGAVKFEWPTNPKTKQ
jgi:FAD synthetase